jgi:ABC-type Fe3+-hydroxamate transport system substrate-binding protein
VASRDIVSLVPSLTELVWWLGAGERLAGRTKFCVEPAELVETVPAMGGTKNPDLARIIAAAPGMVLANKEENRREDIEALQAAGIDVLLTDPNTVSDAVGMIREAGALLGAAERAETLALEIEGLARSSPTRPGPRVYVAVWHNPVMGLGSGTYGHSLVEACGAVNVLRERPRYPEVSLDEIRTLRPDVILLPDEPFPFDEGHARVYSGIAPTHLVDGKLLWWYGPRMPAAIRELRKLFAGQGG